VREVFIKRHTLQNEGTVHDFAFSPDKEQRFLYVVDGSNKWVHILDRKTLEIVDSVGGRAGHGAREFFHIHSMAADSKGNIYLGEVNQGQRYMKYAFRGMGTPTSQARR
jgi:sugar lactone lactonase YvrE